VLLRIKSERFELPGPFSGSITESFDSNAARQATFDRRLDEIGCKKRERDRHIDLTHTAFLTCCDLLNVGHRARYDLIEPSTASGNCTDQARTAFDPRRADLTFGDAVKQARRAAGPGYTCTHPACRSELSVEPPQSTPMVAIFVFLAASTSNMQRASALVDGR
jgi:hypothetical protein